MSMSALLNVVHATQHEPPPPVVSAQSEVLSSKRRGSDGEDDDEGDGDGDGPSRQPRAKRNRYIPIACNECKRRKIRCNGQTPCKRCGEQERDCVYAPNSYNAFKDSPEYKEMSGQLDSTKDAIVQIHQYIKSIAPYIHEGLTPPSPLPATFTSTQDRITNVDPAPASAPSVSRRQSNAFEPQNAPGAQDPPGSPTSGRARKRGPGTRSPYQGPTSSGFNLSVAKTTLRVMGLRNNVRAVDPGNDGADTRDPTPSPTHEDGQLLSSMHPDKDPLWSISKDEAIDHCNTYEDEMGIMYPVLNMKSLKAATRKVYEFMDAGRSNGLIQLGMPGSDSLHSDDVNILKVVVAISLTIGTEGRSDLGQRLIQTVRPAVDSLVLGQVSMQGVRLLVMMAMHEFHSDNEDHACRLIGLTTKLCFELGLHRRETYQAMISDSERTEAVLFFWSIYVLDRRWSFGTGRPFTLHDADIDPDLPKPEHSSPYLNATIDLARIGTQVWRAVVSNSTKVRFNADIDLEQMDKLDHSIVQWLENVHPSLRSNASPAAGKVPIANGTASHRATVRLRYLLGIRANEMRIVVHRPVLHSATSIHAHRKQATAVVEIAKDSIRQLSQLNKSSNLYRAQQCLFNPFLMSAFTVLFLASVHAPVYYVEDVAPEWRMVVELVRGFSESSWIGQRLWKTVSVMKDYARKLGLFKVEVNSPRGPTPKREELEPSRSAAAVAMAGLADHIMDNFKRHQDHDASGSQTEMESTSPNAIANELNRFHEANRSLYKARVDYAEARGDGVAVAASFNMVDSEVTQSDSWKQFYNGLS